MALDGYWKRLKKLTIKIAKNIGMGGGSYIPTPSNIKKQALINVQNLYDLRYMDKKFKFIILTCKRQIC